MQITAQRNNLELDKLAIVTDVTRKRFEEVDSSAREGANNIGMSLEGCRWNSSSGSLDDSLPGEMFCSLPVGKIIFLYPVKFVKLRLIFSILI